MPTAKNEVKLKFGTKEKYASATKNADTVYFITDTHQIFVGSSLVSSKCYYVTASPLASNYGVGDVVIWKLSDSNANICVVNSSGEFDIFSISVPTDEITANTNARHSHTNKDTLDDISGTPIQVVAQTLTDEQKTQARTNIGALGTVVPNPTNDNDAANKKYVDSKVASGEVTVDPSLSDTSTNPVQNKVVKAELDKKFDKAGGTVSGDIHISSEGFLSTNLSAGKIGFGDIDGQSGARIEMRNRPSDLNKPVMTFIGNSGEEKVTLSNIEDPTQDLDAANKQYVDNAVAGAGMKHPIILEENTDYGDSLPANPAEGQLFFQNATSGLLVEQGGTGATTASQALTNLGGLPLTGGRMVNTTASKGVIDHPGNSSGWGNGRDNAFIRRSKAISDSGTYYPLISSKTVNGDWTIGTLSNNLYVNYANDTDYNASNNKLAQQFWFSNNGNLYVPGGIAQLATGTLGANVSATVSAYFDGTVYKNLLILIKSYANNGNLYSSFAIPAIADTWKFFLPTYNDYYRAAVTITGTGGGMRIVAQMDSNYSGGICWIYGTM